MNTNAGGSSREAKLEAMGIGSVMRGLPAALRHLVETKLL